MRLTRALQYGLYDRLLAVGSLLLGLAIALGAIWAGAGDWLLSGEFTNPPGGQSGLIAAAGVLAGLFVWQLGSTAARYRTLVGATERQLGGASADDVDGDLDERIAQLESDVEEVRRVAARIEQSMRTEDVGDAGLDSSSAGAAGGSSATGAPSTAGSDATGSATTADASTAGTGASQSAATADGAATSTSDAAAADDAGTTATGDAATASGSEDTATASTSDDAAAASAGGVQFSDADDAGTTDAAESTDAGASDATADGTTADASGSADATAEPEPATDADAAATQESSADGGTTDDVAQDPFEWPEEDEDGEYYRNS